MEFNQDNRSFRTPIKVLDTVAEQLTDVDLTLPDYCPDIEKILKCTLTPKIQSKSLSGGQLQIDGYCIVNVLYVESIKKTIRCCEQSVNFSQCFSVKETPDSPVIITKTKSEYINCRALSPRRLVMHGAFSLYATIYSASSVKLYAPEAEAELETNKTTLRCADLKSLCQEQFTVCEENSVIDKPTIESIIYSDVSSVVSNVKAVTGKLMVNGEINLKMLYLTDVESGETAKLDYILPFNQIIDCEGINEKTVNCVTCDTLSYDIRLKNDMLSEKPSVILDVKLCITEEGYELRSEEIVTDVYSVSYATAPEFEKLKFTEDVSVLIEPHMQKSSIKIDDGKISKVLNIYSENITADSSQTDNGFCINGKINICILALNEDNFPVFVERSFEYSHNIISNCEYNFLHSVSPRVASISYRLSDDNTIEIRWEIKFTITVLNTENILCVKSVDIFDDRPIQPEKCALTLYFAKEGERLWDIAKSHNTRLDLLVSENSAENSIVEYPQLLLIPRI